MPLAPPRGPPIDIFGFGGGRCQTYRQHPPGGLPSTSSVLVVAATGHTANTPQGPFHQRLQLQWWPLPDLLPATPRGGLHRRLQLRWWLMSDMPPAPLRGPTIDVFNIIGSRCRTCRQHPPGGPPSTSSASVVAVVGPTASTSRGPAIDVSYH
jgi:hypothetical protein